LLQCWQRNGAASCDWSIPGPSCGSIPQEAAGMALSPEQVNALIRAVYEGRIHPRPATYEQVLAMIYPGAALAEARVRHLLERIARRTDSGGPAEGQHGNKPPA
jgi:hypothetical protein